jgi:uncharacterized protein (DUF433 family)
MASEVQELESRTPIANPHIWLDKRGVAWVGNTNVKVIEIVLDKLGWGMDAETIHREFPNISLSEIYAAFSYYHDHQAEMDAQIKESRQEYERLRAESANDPLVQRLRALKAKRES